MKAEEEIRDFLAMMAEHDKELEKQFREHVERQFPNGIDPFRDLPREHIPPVNCRCVVKPMRKEQS